LIALNDPHLSTTSEDLETGDDSQLRTLRLPSLFPWPQRIERATAFRRQHPVDWISLQFVGYAFDRRGMAARLPRDLQPIIGDALFHVMFHELWVGVGETLPPLKERVIGRIQRHYVRRLLRELQPRLITTSIPFYQSLLAKLGFASVELPLFGNIPFSPITQEDSAWAGALLPNIPGGQAGPSNSRYLGLFFGSLHPEWKPEPLLGLLIAFAQKARLRLTLVSVGRLGGPGEMIWEKLRREYAQALDFIALGEQPIQRISALMQVADFGVAASPWHLIGKSGSVVAMLEHGLPVIVTRAPAPTAEAPTVDPLLHRCDTDLAAQLAAGLAKLPPQGRLPSVTDAFLGRLASLPPGPQA
jgi:glycosyltransferase involved in cell wall biosynthesis